METHMSCMSLKQVIYRQKKKYFKKLNYFDPSFAGQKISRENWENIGILKRLQKWRAQFPAA